MLYLRFLLLFISYFSLLSVQAQTILIANESIWKYQDQEVAPLSQGNDDWMSLSYNDNDWLEGPAQIGYGDEDENTIINENAYTGYFRHTFQSSNITGTYPLNLEILFDDGAVVYLNGEEIWRVNMPSGDIGYDTFASSTSSENEIETNFINAVLIEGTNVIAVEVHQKSASSSDLSFDLQLSAIEAELIRGPYLQKVSPESISLKWRTSIADICTVEYGTSVSNLDQSVQVSTVPQTDHEIELLELEPNTVYYYKLRAVSNILQGAEADVYFKTSPENGSQSPYAFWILGDCGSATEDQRLVRDAFYNHSNNAHLDGILFLGDNAYEDGTDEEYQFALFENMYEDRLKNAVAWSCLGNHDGNSASSEDQSGPYYDIFSLPKNGESGGVASGTEAYYSFDYGNIHFICLDSYDSDRSVGGPMYTWCENDLLNTTAEWIVSFWHHPPYSSGDKDSDDETEAVEMRASFLPLLENNGVDLVLTGHSHTYQRSYFLNGHYGNSGTFDCKSHFVGPLGNSDGKEDSAGAYEKVSIGSEADKGAVYVVTGSSGKRTLTSFDHPAMYYSIDQLGSCILEVDANRLDLKFIRETGEVEDYFTIIKDEHNCVDWDEDGYCTDEDPDDMDACNPDVNAYLCVPLNIIQSDDFESGFGNWKDGGSDCTLKSSNANSGNYSVRLRDDSGAGSSMISQRMNLTDYLEVELEFTFFPKSMEDGEELLFEVSDDGGDNYVVYKRWVADEDFENETRYFETINICNNYLGEESRFRFRCNASTNSDYIFIDDIVLKGLQAGCLQGIPCDDGDPCTINSVQDENCNCINGLFSDSDGDGYCTAEDPDDLNPCIPDNQTPNCGTCYTLINDDFESGFGNWNDGGEDCFYNNENVQSGSFNVLLIDNAEESSSTYTNSLDLSGVTSATVSFNYFCIDMENTEDFLLEVSIDNGDEYTIVEDWIAGQDFENEILYFDTVFVDNILFSENTRFRFRCDAHSNQDFVYLDDIEIVACTGVTTNTNTGSGEVSPDATFAYLEEYEEKHARFEVYPNPAIGVTSIHFDIGLEDEQGTIMIYNAHGILMAEMELEPGEAEIRKLDVNGFPSGLYTLYLLRPGKRFIVQKIVVLND